MIVGFRHAGYMPIIQNGASTPNERTTVTLATNKRTIKERASS